MKSFWQSLCLTVTGALLLNLCGGLISRGELLRKYPDTAKRFFRAVVLALQHTRKYKAEHVVNERILNRVQAELRREGRLDP